MSIFFFIFYVTAADACKDAFPPIFTKLHYQTDFSEIKKKTYIELRLLLPIF